MLIFAPEKQDFSWRDSKRHKNPQFISTLSVEATFKDGRNQEAFTAAQQTVKYSLNQIK